MFFGHNLIISNSCLGSTPILQLEKIHSLGIKTFAFVGPLLPGNPEKLIKDLKGKVDKVFIDRMNYVSSIKGFYQQVGLQEQTADRFFHEYKERLISELKKVGMQLTQPVTIYCVNC